LRTGSGKKAMRSEKPRINPLRIDSWRIDPLCALATMAR
jgi:hypothetical protein